jgi:hypothetical protein
MVRWARPCALVLGLLLVTGCGGADKESGTGKTMEKWEINPECDFGNLETGIMRRNPCSPVINDPDFLGLVINAPEEVFYTPGETVEGSLAFADVRVCGTVSVDYAYGGYRGEVTDKILLVAVNAATQETWSGKMEPIPNPEQRPDGLGGGSADNEGLVMESYFNPNLVETLDLPERPAEYIVYAVLGEYKSNTLRILVKERS